MSFSLSPPPPPSALARSRFRSPPLARPPPALSPPHMFCSVAIRTFSPYYAGWVRLADRDPKRPGNINLNPADNCRRQLFDLALGDEKLGEATESMEV